MSGPRSLQWDGHMPPSRYQPRHAKRDRRPVVAACLIVAALVSVAWICLTVTV